MAGQVTEYELQRAQRIQENRRKLAELGVLEASRGLAAAAPTVTQEAGGERQPRCKKRKAEPVQPASLEPTRLSRRLRGETALAQDQAAQAALAEIEAEGGAAARRGSTRKRLALVEGQQLVAPFTLWSIGVTVWELGQVHRGAWAHRYWSSSGCLYHHAYPVGYRATKVQFGRTFEMRIEEGPTGPLFKVIDQQSGAVFAGESPTKPWTDVCIAHRTGQRISGPLFFGFSDPLTQRAIAANLYSEQELQAALQGEKVQSSSVSPEEQAAQEFCRVEGVGEATAIVLARSTALGGSRHEGLESLKAWASASDENAQALFAYLAGSEEVPESTRRWPAWRQRLVPKIVLAVSGRWLGTGPAPGAAPAAATADQGREAEQEQVMQQGVGSVAAGSREQPATEQQQQHGAQQGAAPGSAQASKPAGGTAAKENRQPQSKPRPKATAPAAAAQAQAAAAPAQRSRRERRANSMLAAYHTAEEEGS